MSSLNEEKVYFAAPGEGVGEGSGGALEGPSQNNNVSPGNEGVSPVSGYSKSPSMNSAATSLNFATTSLNSATTSLNSATTSLNPAATSLNEEGEQPVALKDKQSDERIENLVDLFREFLEAASDPATSESTRAHPNTAARRKEKKRFFGLARDSQPKTESNNPYDYEQKYPRDRPGEEAADNARVWLTYLDEAESFDRERVEGWKDTVDVLLVFAGLFSGVITTFVSQASQSLQQDNTQVSASLLFEITRLLRAQFNGTPLNNITSSPLTPTSPFTPSTNILLVNGLWFTSLAIALSTALFAVLAKQWLHYYLTSITGTAQEKARARQLRFQGFESWNVGAIVELLPILLYTAVGMFLTGIIILLFPLDVRVAWTLVIITGTTYVLYFISVLLPIRYPECPYTTSLTIYIGILVFVLRRIFRWISRRTLEKGFQAVWRRVNYNARRTIRHLLYNTLRFINSRLVYTLEFIRRHFRRLRRTVFAADIFADGFPKFTNWREDNIKKAVKDAGFLDFEALNWLYGASLNRSVHRIIAWCAAVYPGIGQQFDEIIQHNLSRTLEISETNLVDLRYGLCLDLLTIGRQHWRLLRSIPDVEEAGTEYRSYSHTAENVIEYHKHDGMMNVLDNNLELPLVMWFYFFEEVSRDATIAARILTSEPRGLFEWKCDPTRGYIPNVGVVSFDSEEMGRCKFDYLYRYFFGRAKPDYSLDKSFETRYLLLITIYRNLTTSDKLLIADKEQRQQSLEYLFMNFEVWLCSKHQGLSSKQYFAFFVDILCDADAFWSESMTDGSRELAVWCLHSIWDSMDTDMTDRFPFTELDDLSPIYQWLSRDLPGGISSCMTAPISILLFMPQNRTHLCTLLSNDPDAISHLRNCFRSLGYSWAQEIADTYPNLMDLLKSVNLKVPGSVFNILYDSSVLVQLWRVFQGSYAKQFLLIVKSKLDQEKLNNLHAAMTEEVRSSKGVHQRRLEILMHEFGQMIGVSRPSATEQSAPEHAHVPDANERGSMRFTIANWSNQAFRSLRLKIHSGNRDRNADVELS